MTAIDCYSSWAVLILAVVVLVLFGVLTDGYFARTRFLAVDAVMFELDACDTMSVLFWVDLD